MLQQIALLRIEPWALERFQKMGDWQIALLPITKYGRPAQLGTLMIAPIDL